MLRFRHDAGNSCLNFELTLVSQVGQFNYLNSIWIMQCRTDSEKFLLKILILRGPDGSCLIHGLFLPLWEILSTYPHIPPLFVHPKICQNLFTFVTFPWQNTWPNKIIRMPGLSGPSGTANRQPDNSWRRPLKLIMCHLYRENPRTRRARLRATAWQILLKFKITCLQKVYI